MKNEVIRVEGMSCAHCVSAIEGGLGELQGVMQVDVDLDQGLVKVSYNESDLSHEQIVDTIEEQGYDVAQ